MQFYTEISESTKTVVARFTFYTSRNLATKLLPVHLGQHNIKTCFTLKTGTQANKISHQLSFLHI